MDASQKSSSLTLYCCNICKTNPDQLSHHKAHLTTQKHIFRKKCFETCIHTGFFNIYNLNKNKDDKIKNKIDEFEKDTGLKFIQGVRASHDAMRDWSISRDCLLEEEFPNTVIPLDISFDTEEKYKNSVIKMIELNETLTVKNKETETETKKLNNEEIITNIKNNIENYDIDFFLNMALETPEPYVIALIMYKLNYDSVCLKRVERNVIHHKTNKIMRFKDKCWVYKDIGNDNPSSNIIATNLRNQISTVITNFFIEEIKDFSESSNEYSVLSNLIHNLKKTFFKNDVMKKLEQLF